MPRDAQGLEVTGTSASVDALEKATIEYFGWAGDPVATLRGAVEKDPAFNLGHTALAALFSLGGVRSDNPLVIDALSRAEAAIGGATPRERQHLAAARAWAGGDFGGAADLWEDLLSRHPTDALALRFAHDAYFMLGRSLSIRDSVARALPAWDRHNSKYGFVLGQYAFGLEEAGELREAETFARRAIAINAADGWAVHAVAHVLETESRQLEGIDFLKASRPSWSRAHALSVHNGWHLALYLIEEGRFDEVLADYDRYVAPRFPADFQLDMIDASAMLWRIELAGGEVGDRWKPLAQNWLRHVDDHVLVFTDLHIALALARAGNSEMIARFRRSLDDYARNGRGYNRQTFVEIGRAIIDGALAFSEGNYARAIALIEPVRHKAHRIGGSHAQRDIVDQTLIVAAMRAGSPLARTLLAERLAVRPTNRTRQDYALAGGITADHSGRVAGATH